MRFLLLVLVLLFGPSLVQAAESISSFTSDIVVAETGKLTITETIVYDFAENERRGIYRLISDQHAQPADRWYQERYIATEVQSVSRNTQPEPYSTQSHADGVYVRIGDPDIYHTGQHTYTITYTADGALIQLPDGQSELYWNVTGSDWAVPMGSVTARLTGVGVSADLDAACYQGIVSATDPCTTLTQSTTTTTYTADNLSPGEALTVAHQVDLSAVPAVYERVRALWAWFAAGFLLLTPIVWWRGRQWRREHSHTDVIITQYDPPADMRPMYSGYIIDGTLSPRDLTAGIIYLAEQGFITIKHTDSKLFGFTSSQYELTLHRPADEAPSQFMGSLLRALFGTRQVGGSVTLEALKKQASFAKKIEQLKADVTADAVEAGYFEYGVGPWAAGLSMVGVVALFALIGLGATGLLSDVWVTAALSTFVGAAVLLLVHSGLTNKRYTEKGFAARNHLLGYKDFLSVTDADRFAFHNAPKRNSETFMVGLPYAIAFGVERAWQEVFADITVPQPDWYAGTGDLTTPQLVTGLTALSRSVSATTTSASSGGGSVGGASSGGGGGSW